MGHGGQQAVWKGVVGENGVDPEERVGPPRDYRSSQTGSTFTTVSKKRSDPEMGSPAFGVIQLPR